MKNKINIIKIVGGVAILGGVLLFAFINITQNKGLDTFAQSYADFRNQEYKTQTVSFVLIVDASSELGKENYFTHMAKALDTQQSNSFRNKNAQQALDLYKSNTQLYINDFAENIGKLNSATLILIEASNRVKNGGYRNTAIKIAQYARQVQQDYETLRLKYAERFNLQTNFLKTLVNNGGDIYAPVSISKLKNAGTKVPILSEEIQNLIEETNKISQKMDDLYFSLKGKAGIKNYPNKFMKNQ